MIYLDRLDPDSEFVALDVETTGRSTQLDVVTEIGAIRYKKGVEVGRFVTLVKPSMPMLPWITRLTGITDAMLRSAPRPAAVAFRLLKFLRRRPLVVHQASFDVPIIARFLTRHALSRGVERPWAPPPVCCTLRLSRRLLPHLRSRRLEALAEYFDCSPRRRFAGLHRAGPDAETVARVFFCLAAKGGRRR